MGPLRTKRPLLNGETGLLVSWRDGQAMTSISNGRFINSRSRRTDRSAGVERQVWPRLTTGNVERTGAATATGYVRTGRHTAAVRSKTIGTDLLPSLRLLASAVDGARTDLE